MITLIVTMKFKEEVAKEAIKLVSILAYESLNEDGCSDYDVWVHGEDTIVIHESFYSEEDLEFHKTTVHYNEILKGELSDMILEKDVKFVKKLQDYFGV